MWPESFGLLDTDSMKKKPLVDRVKAAVEARKSSSRKTWLDRLPDEVRKEITDLKALWLAGEIDSSARRLAISIVETCREDGHSTCNSETMREWLSRG